MDLLPTAGGPETKIFGASGFFSMSTMYCIGFSGCSISNFFNMSSKS